MSGIETFGTKNPNLPFHPAVRAGDFVYVSGQVAKDAAGVMVAGTIEEETRATILALQRALQAAGFGRYNGVFKEFFPEGRLARTTVEARAVISTRIEMDCVAYRPLGEG